MALIGHWENWVRVFLIALIGFIAFDCISRGITKDKTNG